jgi:hypothetical protein
VTALPPDPDPLAALVKKAFSDDILAKAALVIHRVARTMEAENPVRQREAMDLLLTFADGHPLPPEMEKLL